MLSSPVASSASTSTKLNKANPIKLGIEVDIKTAVYDATPQVTSARAAVRGINAAGGIHGREVVLDVCNENFNVNTAATCAHQFISDGVVATVFTLSAAGAGATIASILNTAGISQVGPAVVTPAEYTSPNNYLIGPGSSYDYPCDGVAGVESGLTKQYLLNAGGAADESPALQIAASAIKAAGGSVVGTGDLPYTAADFSPYAQAIVSSGAQGVIAVLATPLYEQLDRALGGLGSKAVLEVDPGTVVPGDLASLGTAVDGTIICSPFPPQTAIKAFPLFKTIKREMAAENAAGDEGTTFNSMSLLSIWSWWDVQAAADVAKLIPGNVDAASMTHELKTVKNLNVGLVPPWTPNDKIGPAAYHDVSNPYEYSIIIKNDKEVLLHSKPINLAKYVK
jgi:ABC-type branched-subunit amino acid transport system substrate-binding protein